MKRCVKEWPEIIGLVPRRQRSDDLVEVQVTEAIRLLGIVMWRSFARPGMEDTGEIRRADSDWDRGILQNNLLHAVEHHVEGVISPTGRLKANSIA